MIRLDRLVGFAMTANADEAKRFYGEVLGLKFLRDDGFALVFDAHGLLVRVGKMPNHKPLQYTTLGWEVADIAAAVADLASRGLAFERYDFMKSDEQGIVTFPNGDKVAWFKDPDGNVLSLSQHT